MIGTQGIFLIKTKDDAGQMVIDKQGNWIRIKEDGSEEGEKNPVSELRKKEKLLKSIVGDDVPMISMVCMTNEKAVVKNEENCKVPVMKCDLIVEFIESYSNHWQFSEEQRKEYQSIIEKYMV